MTIKKKKVKKKEKKKKRPENVLLRTLSNHENYNPDQHRIIEFMAHESKNIYNTTIFFIQLYFKFSNEIYQELDILVSLKKIKNIEQFDNGFYELFDKYYQRYTRINPIRKKNNDIIYGFIKKNIKDITLINSNYYHIKDSFTQEIKRLNIIDLPKNATEDDKKELFYDIVDSIFRSIYTKNFYHKKYFTN